MKIDRASSKNPAIRELLNQHPQVGLVSEGNEWLEFEVDSWNRKIYVDENCGSKGILELIDNNPLLCADEFLLTGKSHLLSTLAFAPLDRVALGYTVETVIDQPSTYFCRINLKNEIEVDELYSIYEEPFSRSPAIDLIWIPPEFKLGLNPDPKLTENSRIRLTVQVLKGHELEIQVVCRNIDQWLCKYSIFAMNVMTGNEDSVGLYS